MKPRVLCPSCDRSLRPHPSGKVRGHDLPGRDGTPCPAGIRKAAHQEER